jgi:hypothetical protein
MNGGPSSASLRLAEGGTSASRMVSLNFASWNQLEGWLRRVEALRLAA